LQTALLAEDVTATAQGDNLQLILHLPNLGSCLLVSQTLELLQLAAEVDILKFPIGIGEHTALESLNLPTLRIDLLEGANLHWSVVSEADEVLSVDDAVVAVVDGVFHDFVILSVSE
jgi:hypothetical protein